MIRRQPFHGLIDLLVLHYVETNPLLKDELGTCPMASLMSIRHV